MYEMKEEYYTGIKQIDEEHSKLFEIANKTYYLYKDEFIPDKYDNIRELLMELKDYTLMHFEHEEAYMESISYKRMFTQKVQHSAFRSKIEEMDFTLEDENKQDKVIAEILELITSWLVDHILENDKLIGTP